MRFIPVDVFAYLLSDLKSLSDTLTNTQTDARTRTHKCTHTHAVKAHFLPLLFSLPLSQTLIHNPAVLIRQN